MGYLMKNLLIGLSLSVLASSAYAADAVVEEVAVDVAPVFVWTGGYVGLQGGYAWGNTDVVDTINATGATNWTYSPDPDGFVGGLYGGFNYQMPNNVVLGIEGDIEYSDVSGTDDAPSAVVNYDLKWQGSVRARLGYAVDRWLPYLTGGVAFGDYEGDFNLGGDTDSFSDDLVGYTIGVGTEYAFTNNLIGRVEYRFTDFGDSDVSLVNFSETIHTNLQTSAVRVGLAYKF